jgi:hypothetical protein
MKLSSLVILAVTLFASVNAAPRITANDAASVLMDDCPSVLMDDSPSVLAGDHEYDLFTKEEVCWKVCYPEARRCSGAWYPRRFGKCWTCCRLL